jgi:hypothetical protein
MSDTNIQVSAKCPVCLTGISWADDVTDETILVCDKCGLEVSTYGDFKDRAIEAAREKAESIIKEALNSR